MGWRTIISKYEGRCKHCYLPTKALTMIKWHNERHIGMHIKCWNERSHEDV